MDEKTLSVDGFQKLSSFSLSLLAHSLSGSLWSSVFLSELAPVADVHGVQPYDFQAQWFFRSKPRAKLMSSCELRRAATCLSLRFLLLILLQSILKSKSKQQWQFNHEEEISLLWLCFSSLYLDSFNLSNVSSILSFEFHFFIWKFVFLSMYSDYDQMKLLVVKKFNLYFEITI